MRYVSYHPTMRDALKNWAGGQEMIVAGQYLWIAGTESDTSQRGFLLFHDFEKSLVDLGAIF